MWVCRVRRDTGTIIDPAVRLSAWWDWVVTPDEELKSSRTREY